MGEGKSRSDVGDGAQDLSLAEAVVSYLAALPNERRQEAQTEVNRFTRWYGADRPLCAVRGHDLALYGEEIGPGSPGAQRRVEALRSFFAFAKRVGWTPTNLATHLRLRKAGRNDASSLLATVQETRLTAQGYAALKQELESLIARRPEVAAGLQRAMADKDFRENSPLEAMREHQAHLEARIRELEAILKEAVIVEARAAAAEAKVRLGSTVALRNLASGTMVRYTLVAPSEVNATQGKISVLSPVGRAVLERGVGDEVEAAAPAGSIHFRIEAIEG
ncbi:MAG: GreA/GreB family elongation factor [Dehalococcoidia bacterium]